VLIPAKAQADDQHSRLAAWTPSDRAGALAAPAAVRVVDLEAPLAEIWLPSGRLGESYRSLVVVVRLDGDPLGVATLSVGHHGLVSRDRLVRALRRQLDAELHEAFAHRGLALPKSLPPEGILAPNGRGGGSARLRRSVSVVVTTCCNPRALERCVLSIFASDYEDFEVIVVENRPGSSATRRMLAERFEDELRLRYVEEPCAGLARARNAGLAMAKGEIVAFTDDDVVVDPGWLRHCEEAFERADDVACVTGLIVPLELEDDSQLLLEQFASFGKGFHRETFRLPEARETHPLLPYTTGVLGSGANTVLRANVARKLGGFETTLGAGTPAAGGEDLDLYTRLLQAGYAVAYEPSAIIWHEHPDGMSRLRRQVYRYGVGLGAMLTKQLVVGPERLGLLRAVPAGVRYARDPSSRKNAAKTPGFPRHLAWLERLGMLIGPVAYVLSAFTAAIRGWPLLRRGSVPAPPALCVQRLRVPSGQTIEVVTFYNRDVAPSPTPRVRRRRSLKRRWEARRAVASPLHRAIVATAAAACVAAPLFVAVGFPATVRLPAVLALMCLAPGTALLAVLRGRFELGLVLGVSLAGSAMLAASMLWLGAWWPKAFLYGLAAACLPTLFFQLDISSLQRALGTRLLASSPPARWSSSGSVTWVFTQPARLEPLTVRDAVGRIPPFFAGHGALLTVALVAWAASLAGADLSRMAGLGLLNAMPPTYFIAFALLLVGFAHAVTREELSPKLLGLYSLALILVLHGTTPLLYDEPRYPWVYKHLAVISLFAEGGGLHRHLDIYNNWPGFFALNAWLSSASGLSAAVYAPWAQVFLNVVNVAAMRFALRGVTDDERLLWTATWLFLLGNWVGQDYLAPQAFGFSLSLVVLGLCLRCGPRPSAPRLRAGWWWAARLDQMRRVLRRAPVDEPPAPAPLSPRAALLVGGLCYVAVVVSHQLTPMMLVAGVTGLALVARRVPLWVPAAMAVIEVCWLALAWSYLSQHFSLLDFDPTASAAPAGYEVGQGLQGLALVGRASAVEVMLLAGLAAIGLFRRARAARWDLAAATLVIAPLLVVGVQSYSGEGRYRLYLFALPWLCFFAAAAFAPRSSSRRFGVLGGWRLALATGALGVCLLFAYFGLELANRVTSADVAAAVWFDQHAPPNSVAVEVTSDSVSRVTARYARVFAPEYPGSPTLTGLPAFRNRSLSRKDLPRLEATLRGYGIEHTFVFLTPSQERFARLYGVLPAGWQRSLERALRASPDFRRVYRRGAASIFEYRPGRSGAVR
jgi:GT2 family glycosyltransferase